MPTGAPTARATCSRDRSARWYSAIASRCALGSLLSAATSATWSGERPASDNPGLGLPLQPLPKDAASPTGPRQVHGDGPQPSLRVVGLSEAAAVLHGSHEGLLNDVLGVRQVAADGVHLADETLVGRVVHLLYEPFTHGLASPVGNVPTTSEPARRLHCGTAL